MHLRKSISYFVLAAFVLFGLGQCLLGQSRSAKERKCCAAMHCSAAMKDHDCCKQMGADNDLQYRAASSISITLVAAPPPVVVSALPAKVPSSVAIRSVEAPQHAPPLELYTLHQSFLI